MSVPYLIGMTPECTSCRALDLSRLKIFQLRMEGIGKLSLLEDAFQGDILSTSRLGYTQTPCIQFRTLEIPQQCMGQSMHGMCHLHTLPFLMTTLSMDPRRLCPEKTLVGTEE
jgi:hypothetical protein